MKLIISIITLFLVYVQANPMLKMWHGKKSANVPYHVHLWVYDEMDFTWPGSGVLITDSHVLTSAVNIYHFNRWDMGFGSASQNELEMITSFNGIVHENFDDVTDDNNLGIIILPKRLEFSDRIAPISLPKHGENLPTVGQIGSITAFSYMTDFGPISRDLNVGNQMILSQSKCQEAYPHLGGIDEHFFCANDEDFNVCGGAQGAGLVIRQNRREMLAGILSFGNIWKDCSNSNHVPAGFVKISEYIDWILLKTKSE